MAEIGSIIDGKYEILKLIGHGGMSKVYLAMDKRLNKQWAVKEIEKRAKDKNNEIIIQSAIAEANMIKKLDHPSLPRIVDIFDKENVIFVIMDYIEGETLSHILEHYNEQPQDVVIDWAKQLCDVLHYLHGCNPPIIYRDMKPANVMLKPDGNIKLIDFGIAREYKQQNIADTVSLGTKGYAAPEQFGGKGQTDARTDIYCLGVTLYHLVTGKNPCEPPYELYPIRTWNANLSGGLEKIILKCTQLNPQDRYQSCAELLYALNHYEEVDDVYRHKQKQKLNKFIALSTATIISLGIGIFGQFMKITSNNANYSNNLQMADVAITNEEKISYYLNAISIKPEAKDAYIGLINVYKSDLCFSVDEEEELKTQISQNLKSLKRITDYADLAFEIGKIYWYYYDYGKTQDNDNQITRMTSSVQWFDDVIKYSEKSSPHYDIAKIYGNIGKFNRDITLNIQEASDTGKYKPYWEDIKQLIDIINTNPNESEIVKLELYKLTINSMEIYARKFTSDGIDEEDMATVFNTVKSQVLENTATSEKTQSLKESIAKRFDITEKAIKNAFPN